MKLFKEYKQEAKEIVSKHWKLLVPMAVVFVLLPATLQQYYPASVLPIIWNFFGAYFFMNVVLYVIRNDEPKTFVQALQDFDFDQFKAYLLANLLVSLYLILWLFVFPVFFVKCYSYVLTPYLAMDNPKANTNELITRSRKLMNGRKGNLFLFQLSFILWTFAVIATVGLLSLYVIPYMQVALGLYYLDCLEKEEQE